MCRPVDREARDSLFSSLEPTFSFGEAGYVGELASIDDQEDSEELRHILAKLYQDLVEAPMLRRHRPFAYCTNRDHQLR